MANDSDQHINTGDQAYITNIDITDPVKISVIEERLQVDKEWVETAKLRIVKTVSEQEEAVNTTLKQDQFEIERVNINKYVETAPEAVRYEGDTTIFSILREELVIQKRIMLIEEVRVTKRQVEKFETTQVTLRKEEINVERLPTDNIS